jgi:mRNA-degrading endonuclease RelE of RelBE toxin-antitoxin system
MISEAMMALPPPVTRWRRRSRRQRSSSSRTPWCATRKGGKPLLFELAGVWAARRGTYRVFYRINETRREVVVLRIEHRRDAYRST